MAIRKAAIPVFSRVRDIVAKSLWLACGSPLKVGLGRWLALACVRAFWKKVTWAASSFMISVNAFLIVAGVTVESVLAPSLCSCIGVLLLYSGNEKACAFVRRTKKRSTRWLQIVRSVLALAHAGFKTFGNYSALRAYQGVMTLPRFCGDRKHKSDGI